MRKIENARDASTVIKNLIGLGRLEEAKKIGNSEEYYMHNYRIQSQLIKIAMIEGDLETAKEIGNREEFKNSIVIQAQMMTVAAMENDFDKVDEIARREDFRGNKFLKDNWLNIYRNKKQYEEQKRKMELTAYNDKSQQFVNKIKTIIYYNKIDDDILKEIKENKDISDYTRTLLLLAVYEKLKLIKNAQKTLKEAKEKNIDTKILNVITERIRNKKAPFDMGFYYNQIRWEFDEELANKFQQEIKKQKEDEERIQKEREEAEAKKRIKYLKIEKIKKAEKARKEGSIYKNIQENKKRKEEYYKKINEQNKLKTQENKNKDNDKEGNKNRKENNININLGKHKNPYSETINRMLFKLKEDQKYTYAKTQSTIQNIKEEAIERMNKIDIMMDHLKDSMKIMESGTEEERKKVSKYLERVCSKFEKLEGKDQEER